MLGLEGRGEIAGTGSLISPTSDHFLLNSEEGAWPKTSPKTLLGSRWKLRSCQDSDLSEPKSEKPFGDRRKKPDAGRFQQLLLPVLGKERIEPWLDGGVSALRWGKEIAGYKITV